MWKDDTCSNSGPIDNEVHGVKGKLTEATKCIVSYVEAIQSQPTRVLDVELDFSMDDDGKIWLLWSGFVSIETTPQDIGLGKQQTVHQEGQHQQLPIEREVITSSPPRRRGVRRRIVDLDVLDETSRGSPASFKFQQVQTLKRHAEEIVMPTYEGKDLAIIPRDNGSIEFKTERHEKCSSGAKSSSRCILSNGKECAGDFCSITTHDQVGDINIPRRHEDSDVTGREEGYNEEANGKLGVIMKLFSVRELNVLRRNKAFRKNIIEGQLDKLQEADTKDYSRQVREPNPNTAVHERKVLWKSIIKARERSDKYQSKRGDVTNQGIQRPTETSSIRREGIRRNRGEKNTAVNDPYDVVTVCSTCFYAYTVFDQALRILNDRPTSKDFSMPHQALLVSNFLRQDVTHYPVESPTQSMAKLPNKGVIKTKRSPVKRSSSPACKVRLDGSEENDKQAAALFPESASSTSPTKQNSYHHHQQHNLEPDCTMAMTINQQRQREQAIEPYKPFGPLDEYLRGLAKLQTSNMVVATHNPNHHCVGKKDTDTSSDKQSSAKKSSSRILDAVVPASRKGMLVGHILVGESDPIASSSISGILENAGYVVTIIGDGKRALELLLPSDNKDTAATSSCATQKEIGKNTRQYDAVILSTDSLLVMDALCVTMALRDSEKFRRSKAQEVLSQAVRFEGHSSLPKIPNHLHDVHHQGDSPAALAAMAKPIPVIAFAKVEKIKADDLKKYMIAGMDGCITKPVEKEALLSTIKAAVPHHLTRKSKDHRQKQTDGGVTMVKGLGFLEKSAAKAAVGMPVARGESSSKEDLIRGILRVDVDTEITYCIIGGSCCSRIARPKNDGGSHLFNLVINNEYLASILSKLLEHTKSLGQFGAASSPSLNSRHVTTTTTPFHLVGYGIGAAVACFYASHYSCPNLRSIVSINGFSYVDSHLAGALHDCMAVFKECPETRLDLPFYFYARYLFSPQYLHRVTPSLALNIYTAVHNPISLAGRVALCDGTLCTVDLRPVLAEIDVPIVCLQSTEGNLVSKNQLETFSTRGTEDRGCYVQSIHRALVGSGGENRTRKEQQVDGPSKLPMIAKTCAVRIKAGHEVFQEARSKVLSLLEEMVTGYHEKNEVVCKNEPSTSLSANFSLGMSDGVQREVNCYSNSEIWRDIVDVLTSSIPAQEESFIENVLHLSHKQRDSQTRTSQVTTTSHKQQQTLSASKRGGVNVNDTTQPTVPVCEVEVEAHGIPIGKAFGEAQKFLAPKHHEISTKNIQQHHSRRCKSPKKHAIDTKTSFKQKNYSEKIPDGAVVSQEILPLNQGRTSSNISNNDPNGKIVPEFREYMNWRLERNRKKLSWMESAATRIQSLVRGHEARKQVKRKREYMAAVRIQQTFRGWKVLRKVVEGLRCIWAAQTLQRYWRWDDRLQAYAGRNLFGLLKNQHQAVTAISSIWRGKMSRQRVQRLVERRNVATMVIQALYKGWKGRKEAFARKKEKMEAISIQRIYRGYLGRNKATSERDKYMFSIAQSAGVEFGRQMLLEHKLHATCLQSEVAVLSNGKIETEKVVEELLEEISRFEEGVSTLESEMHQLGRVEVEEGVILDQEALFDLREQKMRLDSEFGAMLGKISDRKERLSRLESKLARIDQERLTKEEELRTLERKLVVLLEEQQRELEHIRSRQEKKGSVLCDVSGSQEERLYLQHQRPINGGRDTTCCGGPSTKDKQQAAQLMQSTETLMKFGFMSMSMTYFSSLNMIRAMRKVGATDTVMGALVKVQQDNDSAINSSGSGTIGDRIGKETTAMAHSGPEILTGTLKSSQVPGSQPLRVSAWSVDDVGRWLQCLSLSQYQAALAEAAVDGALLYDLNEDDLKNTLGIDHRLHRKKILKAIERLKNAEMEHDKQITLSISQGHLKGQTVKAPADGFGEQKSMLTDQFGNAMDAMGIVTADNDGFLPQSMYDNNKISGDFEGGIPLSFSKLAPMARHKKLKALRHALERVPEKRFVPSLVEQQYAPDVGTTYIPQYEAQAFHMNRAEKHGNTLFLLAAQNGSIKIAKLLLSKGANPNHQNVQGQTAGHYATTYHFFDFAEWLYDADGAGATDSLQNIYQLGPYDGLSPEMPSEDGGALISGENK